MRLPILIMLLVAAASLPPMPTTGTPGCTLPVVSTAVAGRSAGLCPTG